MRFLVDISSDDDGRATGQVTADGGAPIPFSGWVELLRVLEDGTQERERGGPAPGDGA